MEDHCAAALPKAENFSVPVIDLDHLGDSRSRDLVIQDIGEACKKIGCFEVVNHGIPRSIIKGALEAASDFFELPQDVKAQFASDDIKKPIRYGEAFVNNTTKARAFLKLYANPLSDWVQSWPLTPVDYREKMGKYAVEVRRVALQLMGVILESLGLGQASMRKKLDEGMQLIVTNIYSESSKSDLTVGIAPHTDYGYITILIKNCDGFHILSDTDGKGKSWKEVPLGDPESLQVHIGDHLEVLSNGRYESLMHRVILNSRKRISIASTHGLSMDEKVVIPKELVSKQNPNCNYRSYSNRRQRLYWRKSPRIPPPEEHRDRSRMGKNLATVEVSP